MSSTKEKEKSSTFNDKRYLLKFLDTFFGSRNGIKLNPVEGVNFTLETLTYMTSRARADELTKEIVAMFTTDTCPDPKIVIIEPCSGIGGNTISYLADPHIIKVIAHEIVPARKAMLEQNLNAYAFDPQRYEIHDAFNGLKNLKGLNEVKEENEENEGNEVKEENEENEGNEVKEENEENEGNEVKIVVAVDPPWLPQGVSGENYDKSQYILKGITLSERSLEEWLETDFQEADLSTFRVPPGYKLDNIPGYSIWSKLQGRKRNVQITYAKRVVT